MLPMKWQLLCKETKILQMWSKELRGLTWKGQNLKERNDMRHLGKQVIKHSKISDVL